MASGHFTCCWLIRFGGDAFPPFVVFKIFTSMSSRERNRERGSSKGQGPVESGNKGGIMSSSSVGDHSSASADKTSGIKYISGRRMIRPDSEVSK